MSRLWQPRSTRPGLSSWIGADLIARVSVGLMVRSGLILGYLPGEGRGVFHVKRQMTTLPARGIQLP